MHRSSGDWIPKNTDFSLPGDGTVVLLIAFSGLLLNIQIFHN